MKEIEAFTDELAETLYADFSDATLSSSKQQAEIGFDRQAESLQEAIRSAVDDVRSHGLKIARVEIEEEHLAEMGLCR